MFHCAQGSHSEEEEKTSYSISQILIVLLEGLDSSSVNLSVCNYSFKMIHGATVWNEQSRVILQ